AIGVSQSSLAVMPPPSPPRIWRSSEGCNGRRGSACLRVSFFFISRDDNANAGALRRCWSGGGPPGTGAGGARGGVGAGGRGGARGGGGRERGSADRGQLAPHLGGHPARREPRDRQHGREAAVDAAEDLADLGYRERVAGDLELAVHEFGGVLERLPREVADV